MHLLVGVVLLHAHTTCGKYFNNYNLEEGQSMGLVDSIVNITHNCKIIMMTLSLNFSVISPNSCILKSSFSECDPCRLR